MTTFALSLEVARIKLVLWRLLAERALCRAIRRAIAWLAPAG